MSEQERPEQEAGAASGPSATPGQEQAESSEAERRSALLDSWREVGELLRELGNRLAAAIRTAWQEEKPQEQLDRPEYIEADAQAGQAEQTERGGQAEGLSNVRDELRVAADRLDRVVRRVASETTQERSAAFEATRKASEESLTELGNVTIDALRTLSRQLNQFVNRVEEERGSRKASDTPDEPAEPKEPQQPQQPQPPVV